jgi:hypothetical protein
MRRHCHCLVQWCYRPFRFNVSDYMFSQKMEFTIVVIELAWFGWYDFLSSGIIVVWNVRGLPSCTAHCTQKLNKNNSVGILNTSLLYCQFVPHFNSFVFSTIYNNVCLNLYIYIYVLIWRNNLRNSILWAQPIYFPKLHQMN